MTLREKQHLFSQCLANLLQQAAALGYEVSLGEVWRSPQEAARLKNKNSLHCLRLAVDLNLFQEGKLLRKSEDHTTLGEWWEVQHPLCRWGGRFKDGNHYSLEHEGRA